MAENQTQRFCNRNRRCGKDLGHPGKCNSVRPFHLFWRSSPNHAAHSKNLLKEEIKTISERKEMLNEELNDKETQLAILNTSKESLQLEVNELITTKNTMDEKHEHEKNVLEKELADMNKEYEKLRLILEQKSYARKRREKNPTTIEFMKDSSNSTKYRRQTETKNLLEFIHGGEEGAVYGAWDFLCRYGSPEVMEKMFLFYKRGKFVEKLFGKFNTIKVKSEAEVKKAVATKYLTHLSRRKYQFMCKIQSSTFKNEMTESSQITYNETKLDLRTATVSNEVVDKFVKSLDIGQIHQITGISGVSRTATALVTMIIDLHMKVPSLREQLLWFNDVENHFIFEFSDDGAPECKDKTMTIGSLTAWNFGNRVRSREYHYPLHTMTLSEKDKVCEALWKQHTDEMELLESNVLHINNEKITVEFQPSADQAWQIWANNVVSASATYPSPFANVHKSQLSYVSGSIGHQTTDKWNPPTAKSRNEEVLKLNEFKETLPKDSTEDKKHSKVLDFLAVNGMRQLGEPRIGIFSNRQRPEPMHLEINSWQHVLNLIYQEAVRRGKVTEFISVLGNSKTMVEKPGCGLSFVAKEVQEHFGSEKSRYNKLSIRLIGSQAIQIARYGFRLADSLMLDNESDPQKIKRLAISKIVQYLRDVGALINRVHVTKSYPADVKDACEMYFKLFALFFVQDCNVTVWTLGYVVPYHCEQLYNEYKIGFGILSMQGKESKHSAIKQELRLGTNRTSEGPNGKWFQLMRSSFVRNFYLPYHFPIQTSYHSHFQSRIPISESGEMRCACFRDLQATADVCNNCVECEEIVTSVQLGSLTSDLVEKLKPISCEHCSKRFADILSCDRHVTVSHNVVENSRAESRQVVPQNMSLKELREELLARNLSATGCKKVLQRRLEGDLSTEL